MADLPKELTELKDLKEFNTACGNFSAKANSFASIVLGLPGGVAGIVLISSGTLINSIGEFVDLLNNAFFAEPSAQNKLGGLIPLYKNLAEVNAKFAKKLEELAAGITGVEPNNIFQYGKIGQFAITLANKLRRELEVAPDNFAIVKFGKEAYNSFWHSFADLVEGFGKLMDAASKLVYLAAMSYRATAKINKEIIDGIQKIFTPLHHTLQGLSKLCHWIGGTVNDAGKYIDYNKQIEALGNKINNMLNSQGMQHNLAPDIR